MKLEADTLYHIYNQGNNRQQIFFSNEDYLAFLKLYRKHVADYCETLSYCLMPNHFHFIVYTNHKSVEQKKLGSINIQLLSDGFRKLSSAYAQETNLRRRASGSLFRQKTKAKDLSVTLFNKYFSYAELCFFYIHQNPIDAGLVKNVTDWNFSSAKDYAGIRNGTLCNRELAFKLFEWDTEDVSFFKQQYAIDKKAMDSFWAKK